MSKILIASVFGTLALLGLPGVSSAQHNGGHSGGGHSGGGHSGGGHDGGGHGGGYGGGYNHGGYGHDGYGYGRGFYGPSIGLYLGGYGRGYGYGGYGYGGYGYGSPYYGSSYYYAPSYNYVQPQYSYAEPVITARPSYYAPEAAAPVVAAEQQNPNAAMLEVRVPENAELWFEGDKSNQTGDVRHFVSPSLQADRTFTYEVRARWMDASGKPVDRTKQVRVQAGARIGVDFNAP